uniref:hydroxyisourate hydrolase n=1 Tax=Anopheles culicifacies TaxID=139723 RepID=A0A182MAN2_9DIPT
MPFPLVPPPILPASHRISAPAIREKSKELCVSFQNTEPTPSTSREKSKEPMVIFKGIDAEPTTSHEKSKELTGTLKNTESASSTIREKPKATTTFKDKEPARSTNREKAKEPSVSFKTSDDYAEKMQIACARYQSRHRCGRMLATLAAALTVLLIADSVPTAASVVATINRNLQTDNSNTTVTMQNLSTHILDTTRGKPAPEVPVTLHYRTSSQTWTKISTGITDGDGRFRNFFTDGQSALEQGVYKLHFDVGPYFRGRGVQSLYPFIEIVFTVADATQHYHIPLLLNPFGYSTYRGS